MFLQARNLDGNTGFIPENYIQILDDNSVSSPTVDQISDTASTEVVPQENLTNSIAETNSLQNSECVSSYSSNDYEVQAATVPQDLPILTGDLKIWHDMCILECFILFIILVLLFDLFYCPNLSYSI